MHLSSGVISVLLASAIVCGIAAPQPEVPIGLVVPLSGGAAMWGAETLRASQVLEKMLPGMKLNHRYRFLKEDGQCGQGSASLTAAQKLVNIDKTRFLVVACSGAVLQVAPFANRAKALVMGQACGHPEIADAGDYIFRTDANFGRAMTLLAEHMKKKGHHAVALLTEEGSFPFALRDALKRELGESAIAASEEFQAKSLDFLTLLTRIQKHSPDAIFIAPGSAESYQALVRQVRALRVRPPLYAYYLPANPANRRALGALQDGIEFIDFHRPPAEESSPDYQRFLEIYRELFPEGPDEPWMTYTAFNGIMSFIQGIEAAGTDPESVRSWLQKNAIHGAAGDFRFDKNGDVDINPYVVLRMKNGEPSPL